MLKNHIYIGFMILLLTVTMVGIIIVVLMYLTGPEISVAKPSGSKFMIDHDGGGDDAMAIFIALLNEKYFNGPQVISITTTYGNVNETQAFINTQRILRIANRSDAISFALQTVITFSTEAAQASRWASRMFACLPVFYMRIVLESVPIYRGSNGPFVSGIETDYYYGFDGLGDNPQEEFELTDPKPEHAAVGLIEMSKLYEGNLTVIAIGSLTNIALALQMDSNFIDRLAHLYVGAGTIHSTEFSDAEFNAAMDPEAYYMVTKHATPDKVTVVPFSQVQTYLGTTKEWRISVLGSISSPIMKAMNDFERKSLAASEDWSQLDPAVMGIALHNNLIDEMKYSNNGIILCGEDRAINTNEFTNNTEGANVQLFYSATRDSYKIFLMDTFSAGLS